MLVYQRVHPWKRCVSFMVCLSSASPCSRTCSSCPGHSRDQAAVIWENGLGHRNLKDRKVIFRQKLGANTCSYACWTSDDSFWAYCTDNFRGSVARHKLGLFGKLGGAFPNPSGCLGNGNGGIETAVQTPSTSWRERLGTYFWGKLEQPEG